MSDRAESVSGAQRIPFGEETEEHLGDDGPLLFAPFEADIERGECHDCGAEPGELHMKGCDAEQCPECGQQLISCEHGGEILDG